MLHTFSVSPFSGHLETVQCMSIRVSLYRITPKEHVMADPVTEWLHGWVQVVPVARHFARNYRQSIGLDSTYEFYDEYDEFAIRAKISSSSRLPLHLSTFRTIFSPCHTSHNFPTTWAVADVVFFWRHHLHPYNADICTMRPIHGCT